MSLTKNIITSAVAGSVAGIITNFFVKNKRTVKSANFERPIKTKENVKFASASEDIHFFV